MAKCMRCGCKYDSHSSRTSNLTVRTYLKSNKPGLADRDVTIKVANLCNECTKSLFIWIGSPPKGEEDQNGYMPFNWSTVCKACGRKFYFVDEKALLEQNLGVPIVEDGKMMIETCPYCALERIGDAE